MKFEKQEEDGEDEENEEGEEDDEEEEDDDSGPLLFGQDVNAARYLDGHKQIPKDQVASDETIEKLFKEGYTMQV